MSEKQSKEKNCTNEEVVEDITKDLESQLTISSEHKENFKTECASATDIGENERKFGIPTDFEESETNEELKQDIFDDYVNEDQLKKLEISLTEEEMETRHREALDLKTRGNYEFKMEQYLDSVNTYTEALRICPLKYENDRSIFYANRAASKTKLDKKQCAIDDCTKAIELNDKYVKAYLRRAKLYEETDKLDESLEDYKSILKFDPGNKDALQAQYRLPPLIQERNEKLKNEMLGKLKDLGNIILKPFGLSTNNFQLNQDSNSGGYTINFTQNPTG